MTPGDRCWLSLRFDSCELLQGLRVPDSLHLLGRKVFLHISSNLLTITSDLCPGLLRTQGRGAFLRLPFNTAAMSYGAIDGSSFSGRNPFGGPSRQGYQPLASQIDPNEIQEVFQELTANIFCINTNVTSLEKSLQALGTPNDTQELRDGLHTTQQETNKTISSSTKYIKQLSEIVRGSSRREWLQLDRLKNQLSDSIQRYGGLQKKVAEKSRALLPAPQKDRQIARNPFTEISDEDEFFGRGSGKWQADDTSDPTQAQSQAFLSEISEDEVESVKQREEAILQIEVSNRFECNNSIEANIENAASNVVSANEQLAKANQHQPYLPREDGGELDRHSAVGMGDPGFRTSDIIHTWCNLQEMNLQCFGPDFHGNWKIFENSV
ncbi:t-SNARE domain-containing protein 1 [Chiloscyllium plagiosum]|uniref:t-SNARE domain-containing protein 1 n=1 Tax=Chiloscyllium plagiosum TaxID=36176 RepID=UPI001CB7E0D4|nr:t-SNARE domain-containing protein 1 [Chiloscyllium plagiosum]